jgi:hypothetical protein
VSNYKNLPAPEMKTTEMKETVNTVDCAFFIGDFYMGFDGGSFFIFLCAFVQVCFGH